MRKVPKRGLQPHSQGTIPNPNPMGGFTPQHMLQQPYQWGAQQDLYQSGFSMNPALNAGNYGSPYISQPQFTAPAQMMNRAYPGPQQPNYAQSGSSAWGHQPFYNPQGMQPVNPQVMHNPQVMQPVNPQFLQPVNPQVHPAIPQGMHPVNPQSYPNAAYYNQPALLPQPAFIQQPVEVEADQEVAIDPGHGQEDQSEE